MFIVEKGKAKIWLDCKLVLHIYIYKKYCTYFSELVSKSIIMFFQGYEEDDKNVEIIMEVEIDKRKEEFTDFYWIVRRNLRIFEGERECIRTSGSSRRDENCYESLRRTKIRNTDSDDSTRTKFFLGLPSRNNAKHIVKYELILLIDRLELEDMENRIFLVKDYREVRILIL